MTFVFKFYLEEAVESTDDYCFLCSSCFFSISFPFSYSPFYFSKRSFCKALQLGQLFSLSSNLSESSFMNSYLSLLSLDWVWIWSSLRWWFAYFSLSFSLSYCCYFDWISFLAIALSLSSAILDFSFTSLSFSFRHLSLSVIASSFSCVNRCMVSAFSDKDYFCFWIISSLSLSEASILSTEYSLS